jgi:hypothetical protein
MSERRIALVAEGPTDAIIIEAALKALLPNPFVLTLLQPEPTLPKLGEGWGGVLRWCQEFAARGHATIEDDETLPEFSLYVIHLDADVAEKEYADVSAEIDAQAKRIGWPPLPCGVPCPPPTNSANEVRDRLQAWLNVEALGPKTVLCVPSKSIEAWLAAALLSNGHRLLAEIECNLNLEDQLAVLQKAERVKKSKREYQGHSSKISEAWATVRQRCSQADRFSDDVSTVEF